MSSRYAFSASDTAVGELLKRALPDRARSKIYGIGLVERRWAEAVGDELARRSVPDSLTDGVLTVRVTDAAWGRMILKLGRQVVAQLNRALGAKLVRRVNFKVVSNLRVTYVPEPRREPLVAPVPEAIAEAARAIEDEDLRAQVSLTAARYLARQQERNERRTRGREERDA